MKKTIALLLAAIMALSLFAGCQSQPAETTTTPTSGSNTTAPTTEAAPEEFSYPMDTDVTLTAYLSKTYISKTNVAFNDTPFAAAVQEATGIKVEYQDTDVDQEAAWLQMLSSGKFPDIINPSAGTKCSSVGAVRDAGFAIELTEVINNYMPNLKAFLEANPDLDRDMKTDDGEYYVIPHIAEAANSYCFGGFYRQDLLEEMGEEEPTTVEGWHDLLVKVKEKYNIILLTFNMAHLKYSPLAQAFGVSQSDGGNGFAIDNNQNAYFMKNTSEMKAFLETVNAWYEEGLIDPDVASIGSPDVRAKMINGQAFMSWDWLTGGMQIVQISGSELNEDFQLKACPAFMLEEGVPAEFAYNEDQFMPTYGFAISVSCENIEEAARFLDYGFSEAGNLMYNYGIEGVSYDMVDGKPVMKESLLDEAIASDPGVQAYLSMWAPTTLGLGCCHVKTLEMYQVTMTEQCVKDAQMIWMNGSKDGGVAHKIPRNLVYTEEVL